MSSTLFFFYFSFDYLPQKKRTNLSYVTDKEGISLVAYHAKINEDFNGLEPGSIARDIVKHKNCRWTYQDKTTVLKKNDIIYYWVHVVNNKVGYNLLGRKYIVKSWFVF